MGGEKGRARIITAWSTGWGGEKKGKMNGGKNEMSHPEYLADFTYCSTKLVTELWTPRYITAAHKQRVDVSRTLLNFLPEERKFYIGEAEEGTSTGTTQVRAPKANSKWNARKLTGKRRYDFEGSKNQWGRDPLKIMSLQPHGNCKGYRGR